MNSRNKGAAGEREVAGILRGYGYKARRGQQYSGANGDADVVGLPGIHIEVKRREKLNIYDAIDQAKETENRMNFQQYFIGRIILSGLLRCHWRTG